MSWKLPKDDRLPRAVRDYQETKARIRTLSASGGLTDDEVGAIAARFALKAGSPGWKQRLGALAVLVLLVGFGIVVHSIRLDDVSVELDLETQRIDLGLVPLRTASAWPLQFEEGTPILESVAIHSIRIETPWFRELSDGRSRACTVSVDRQSNSKEALTLTQLKVASGSRLSLQHEPNQFRINGLLSASGLQLRLPSSARVSSDWCQGFIKSASVVSALDARYRLIRFPIPHNTECEVRFTPKDFGWRSPILRVAWIGFETELQHEARSRGREPVEVAIGGYSSLNPVRSAKLAVRDLGWVSDLSPASLKNRAVVAIESSTAVIELSGKPGLLEAVASLDRIAAGEVPSEIPVADLSRYLPTLADRFRERSPLLHAVLFASAALGVLSAFVRFAQQ